MGINFKSTIKVCIFCQMGSIDFLSKSTKRSNMKLFAGLVASAAAGSSVTCNNVSTGAVEMKMMVDVADVADAAGPGADWTRSAGQWEKIYTPTAADTTEVTGNLQVTKVVDSNGCDKKTVDGVEVCISKGHQFTFTCNYPLADQTISTDSDFTVSGSDTIDSAVNYGSLNYALTVDAGATFAIGNAVTATITPVSSGLVTATILSCEVTNSDLSIDNQVSVIKTQASSCQTECSTGWTLFNMNGESTCLHYHGSAPITTAAGICANLASRLPLPVNEQQSTDMRDAFNSLVSYGHVALDGNDSNAENQWRRDDGTIIGYFNWNTGMQQPDNSNGQDFLGMHKDNSMWNDFTPNSNLHVVCQQDTCAIHDIQNPTCDLGVTITTGQGDSTLGFAFNSFKWSTSKVGGNNVAENQSLTCAIALAKSPPTVNAQKCT